LMKFERVLNHHFWHDNPSSITLFCCHIRIPGLIHSTLTVPSQNIIII
jgi:hypothetical protein